MLHTQIRAFDAVAHHGSFSRAAEALGLTQPAVTIQVKALEERYGVKLLERSRRSVRLTEMGERLFRMSRRYSSLEEQMREILTESSELESGQLSLTADGPHIAMGVFARFLGAPSQHRTLRRHGQHAVRARAVAGAADRPRHPARRGTPPARSMRCRCGGIRPC